MVRPFISGSDAEAALTRLWQESEVEARNFRENFIAQVDHATKDRQGRPAPYPASGEQWMGAILDGMVVETGAVFAAKFMLPWSFSEQAAAATKPPGLFGIDLPRPHITEVRVVDPSTSGTAPAEFGAPNLEAFADRPAIDKTALPIGAPRRHRDKDRLAFVASHPCILRGRRPADADHIRLAQHPALGHKVSDESARAPCQGPDLEPPLWNVRYSPASFGSTRPNPGLLRDGPCHPVRPRIALGGLTGPPMHERLAGPALPHQGLPGSAYANEPANRVEALAPWSSSPEPTKGDWIWLCRPRPVSSICSGPVLYLLGRIQWPGFSALPQPG